MTLLNMKNKDLSLHKHELLVNLCVSPKRVDALTWTDKQDQLGRRVHLRNFPKGHSLQLYRLPFSTERTDY